MLVAGGILVLGLVLLTAGAEALVRGASQLAVALGLSPLFIGLTLVAYGTSAPELVVSAAASLRGLHGMAIGNVVGSNIFNTGLVVGVTALIAPIGCVAGLIRREAALVVLTTAVLVVLAWNGELTRWEAVLLLLALIGYTGWYYRRALQTAGAAVAEFRGRNWRGGVPPLVHLLLVVIGVGLLVLGARWVVDGAVGLAELLGVSKTLIGLTIVAVGTSLPELTTSAVAARRRQTDIAIGNVLGSNIFNLLGILGFAGLLHPLQVPAHIIRFDIPVALVFALACIPIGLSGRRISRPEGAVLLLGYIAYLTVVIVRASTVS
jgi:cation:H+ antiporter